MLQQPRQKTIKYGVLMLILSCKLYSLLFLLKNDIVFIECSNRVKQRCVFRLHRSDLGHHSCRRNHHRKFFILWLHRLSLRLHPPRCDHHFGFCVFRLHRINFHHHSRHCDHHQRVCVCLTSHEHLLVVKTIVLSSNFN